MRAVGNLLHQLQALLHLQKEQWGARHRAGEGKVSRRGSSVWMIVGGESGPCAAGTSIAGEAAAKAGELGEGAMADSGALCEPRSQMTATSPENS